MTRPAKSPKRKRSHPTASPSASSPPPSITDGPYYPPLEQEIAGQSPRTKVASRFGDLHLEGDGVSKLDLTKDNQEPDTAMKDAGPSKKRKKTLEDHDPESPGIAQGRKGISINQTPATHDNESRPAVFTGFPNQMDRGPTLAKSYPSINRLADSKSRSHLRTGTPPLHGAGKSFSGDSEAAIVEPIRSALTWHDDEITGHDPDDPDDDGEGINGIGFKPTAAQAEARSQRRKQQLADYRSRESKEARSRRNERRRGSPVTNRNTTIVDAETARRVRFSEGGSMIKTTGT
ncbi:MAG: hypothetical protein M1818_007811 [Claussenomyces sp. TS43310]|nr:MAG: hypothetical protein M1818_007811 [Claussenomyces sp. TS43310]